MAGIRSMDNGGIVWSCLSYQSVDCSADSASRCEPNRWTMVEWNCLSYQSVDYSADSALRCELTIAIRGRGHNTLALSSETAMLPCVGLLSEVVGMVCSCLREQIADSAFEVRAITIKERNALTS
jgi:hypothetical protein